jgi:hypothetical protein
MSVVKDGDCWRIEGMALNVPCWHSPRMSLASCSRKWKKVRPMNCAPASKPRLPDLPNLSNPMDNSYRGSAYATIVQGGASLPGLQSPASGTRLQNLPVSQRLLATIAAGSRQRSTQLRFGRRRPHQKHPCRPPFQVRTVPMPVCPLPCICISFASFCPKAHRFPVVVALGLH